MGGSWRTLGAQAFNNIRSQRRPKSQDVCPALSFDLHRIERAVLAWPQPNVNRLNDYVRQRLVRLRADVQRDSIITSVATVQHNALQRHIAREFVATAVRSKNLDR